MYNILNTENALILSWIGRDTSIEYNKQPIGKPKINKLINQSITLINSENQYFRITLLYS
jgi:hypothetical protein